MTSSSSYFTLPILTEKTFARWKMKIANVLEAEDLLSVADGSEGKPAAAQAIISIPGIRVMPKQRPSSEAHGQPARLHCQRMRDIEGDDGQVGPNVRAPRQPDISARRGRSCLTSGGTRKRQQQNYWPRLM